MYHRRWSRVFLCLWCVTACNTESGDGTDWSGPGDEGADMGGDPSDDSPDSGGLDDGSTAEEDGGSEGADSNGDGTEGGDDSGEGDPTEDDGGDGSDAGDSGADDGGTADDGSEAGDEGSEEDSGDDGGDPDSPPQDVQAIGANTTVGLDWVTVAGASGYRIYWSTTAGVTPDSAEMLEAEGPGFVHRGVTNGTTYYYVITAVSGQVETEPSAEVSATPGGEWVLEEFGSGVFNDIVTGGPTAKVPIEDRNHILLFAEGYRAEDMVQFHDLDNHDGDRSNDVDAWIDLVFSIEPYSLFPEAFVVWTIPRESNGTIRDTDPDTAWDVPVDVSTDFPATGNVGSEGETAARAWAAIADHPFPPTDFGGGGFGSARQATAAFLIFDPERGRASVSGRATSLRNPEDTQQRISSAFGVGHAHEFSHAFAALRDEYMENDNSLPNFSATSNVTPGSVCSEVPWSHLLEGEGYNTTDELIGAFGRPERGYHSEFLCLLNGTHDNAEYWGGSGLLRVEDRMCNWCRELATYHTFSRATLVTDYDQWVSTYRQPFYEQFGVNVPDIVPQTNDVRNPEKGTPVWEACSDGADSAVVVTPMAPLRAHGCVVDVDPRDW